MRQELHAICTHVQLQCFYEIYRLQPNQGEIKPNAIFHSQTVCSNKFTFSEMAEQANYLMSINERTLQGAAWLNEHSIMVCIIYFQREPVSVWIVSQVYKHSSDVDVSTQNLGKRASPWKLGVCNYFYWTFLPLCFFSLLSAENQASGRGDEHACTFDMNECAGDFVYRPLSFQLSVGSKSALRNNLMGIFISHTCTCRSRGIFVPVCRIAEAFGSGNN